MQWKLQTERNLRASGGVNTVRMTVTVLLILNPANYLAKIEQAIP